MLNLGDSYYCLEWVILLVFKMYVCDSIPSSSKVGALEAWKGLVGERMR